MFIISPYSHPPGTMLSAIQRLGLTSGLKLCLDAGDVNSYPGSGQKWLDVSGNGYDFFFGSDGTAQAVDPTFAGVAGRQSSGEYIDFADGDYMQYDASNETWMQNLHKDNAKFSAVFLAYVPTIVDAVCILAGTNGGAFANIGVTFYVSASTSNVNFYASASAASFVFGGSSLSTVTINGWNYIAISVDEATDSYVIQINGNADSRTLSKSAPPSASNATYTMHLGDDGDANIAAQPGQRFASVAFWEGITLTAAQLSALYQSTKTKFGL